MHVNSQHYVESERPSPVGLYKIESKHDPVIDHVVHRPHMSIACCIMFIIVVRSIQTDGGASLALRALRLV